MYNGVKSKLIIEKASGWVKGISMDIVTEVLKKYIENPNINLLDWRLEREEQCIVIIIEDKY